ncbi:MAG: TetR/AcrR family transcriptional regulator [Oscillospiraceae bacterium]|jgi:AcrR family transcriptional regulator
MAADRRVTRTKAALTAALFELLGEKDFSKISVTELTRRADVDRKTFYLHYQTVDEILEEFYEDSLRALRESIDREGIFRTESVDMTAFFRVLCELANRDMPLFRRLARGGGYTYYMERVRTLLRDGIENFYRGQGVHSEPELRLLGEFYAAAIMRVYLIWLKGEADMDEARLAELMGKAAGGAASL